MKHNFNPTILRAYDIRGIVGETLSIDDAYAIGRSYATYIARIYAENIHAVNTENKTNISVTELPLTVAVGRDGRLSSPAMEGALVKGLTDSGINVLTIGVGPTPMLYYTVFKENLAGGIMITGSHNPPNHNGFKMMRGKAALFGDEIQQLGEIAATGDFINVSKNSSDNASGIAKNIDVFNDYVNEITKGFEPHLAKRDLKIAWDAGNGAAGAVMAEVVKNLAGEHILLNEKIDGTFPSHHPDPSEPENLQQLIEVVKSQKCDIGVAFDGDGDRVGAVDGNGRILFGDQLMMLYAADVLSQPKYKNANVIADVKASQLLFNEVSRLGGTPIMWKTGHSFIKAKIAETGAALAGEMSGHIFFADRYFGYDDGLYAAIRLMNITAKADDNFIELIDSLPTGCNTPEIRIDVTEERKFIIIDEVKQRLTDANADVSDIDGVRVNSKNGGWWLLRASNTQAALVARCEAINEDELEILKSSLKEQLSLSGVKIDI